MKLVIVESPSKSKTISKYLGENFVVRASVGHVRDLPKSSKKAIDIEGGFIPHYEIVAKKEGVLADISAEAKKSDEIILASDPDREGEAIAWHISEILKERLGKTVARKIKRIAFHEITKEAIEEALQHPRIIDENLKEAQEARRVLDRLVGYDLSGLIWKKVRYGLSAGRVQSPALRIIVEREREIRAFKSEAFWVIEGIWKTVTGESLGLVCSKEPRDKKEVEDIITRARTEKWQVIDIEESEVKRAPRAPFITSTLQQAASSRLGFSPSRTMGIAQKLYESGAITYMRTDSTNLGTQALDQIGAVVKKQYGENYLSFRKYTTKSKNAQEAHEAIRPSHFDRLNAGHTDEQKKLYRLIWQRAVASQMTDAQIMRTKIIAKIQTSRSDLAEFPNFEATGSRILFDGWLKADPESNGEEITLPKCAKDEPLDLISIDSQEKQTLPPPRYTEAGLIKELEKRGIGRPSTYASICKTIEDRGYVAKEGRSLRPTDTGEVVSSFLEEYFPTYISDTFTAEMEDHLDEIANGTRTYLKTLSEFYGPFHKEVKSKEKVAKATNLGVADAKFKCPKCGTTPMEIKLGRNGKFLSCVKYPDCDGALTLDGHEFKKDEPIGTDPTTGLPIFVLNGRFGPYVQLGLKLPKIKKTRSKKLVISETITTLITPAPESPVETTPAPIKPKMASIPRGTDPSTVTVVDALKYLSLPRNLGVDPKTGKDVVASAGRFGPYVVSDGNYRSIKTPDNVYDIDLKRALEMLAVEKKPRGFAKKKKAVE
ncbi:MAG: DNA topoisomerase I [Candidatus Taylorbacteria bacterium RIFCSPHIGHO2_02_FULL_45_28]|uniref:DNA topoisomerase 1 n=1 Tax=Candidatus Taylorbacteria bacterium RIFCSPHIGHO2_12_FULL_45_16 TaxID=1802315 RepID=A0A1G2MYQ4_9BACT|nr:MAG: DNA topoisomerase I [Candidatus Taylorbacteria bacterium RIFCSPHIGHO2_01_FULL_44_110]OHA25116.1 MAG: DNA topoisomerase I [Candidatus Taylorbacteria bacterium RIFCSPHIGHO2_02_FULL_45_28]OHA28997.1 MAG: DNA topoisomerase I [Candidatus Taylorbacteria bacterium RIFCSPHIGHO2_12_FULL_45_16]OHA33115.1 MAG: DNA topoisomerase I [Candidatus Taylorbacteria bacterium RIFCSPLOWO2_01_FULL_45_59]OHA44338.1 MAG: DNA topoisomerase I [Candidatus Taylorbacteria bacterium RIFCSPLOWO2_12_FULL_44_9]